MKKFFKIVGIIVGAIVILIVAGIIYFNATHPDVDPPSVVKVEPTPERLERGKYIVEHVAVCIDCHSTRDWTKYAGPIVPGTIGKGGEPFAPELGTLTAKNITPTVIGSWSDGELMRAITCGVDNKDRALFPIMPYMNYNQLSEEDINSMIAYVRTLKPLENNVPDTDLKFPMSMIVKTMPIKTYKPAQMPDTSNELEYGKYLVTMASCGDCHTPTDDKGQPLPGMQFSGGMAFPLPSGTVRSANITPDIATGIGSWTKDMFLARFKAFQSDSLKQIPVNKGDFNTVMPWYLFSGMTDHDLGAIFTYLHSIKPVSNTIERFTSAKM